MWNSLKNHRSHGIMKTGLIFFMVLIAISVSSTPCFADTLAPIQVKVAVLKDFQPQYSISQAGKPQGFAIDIIEKIARLANLEIDYCILNTWGEMFEALKDGQVDLIPNQGITERRKEWFAFSHPVETFHVSIFTRVRDNKITGFKSLTDKKVAVVRLNISEMLVVNEPSIVVQKYSLVEEALFNLLSGNADAMIFPEPVLWSLARRAGIEDKIKVVGRPLTEVMRGISVEKNNQILLRRINVAVEKLIGSDEYKKIYTRWYGKPEPYWTVKRTAVSLITLLIVAVGFMGLLRYRSTMRLNLKLQGSFDKLSAAEKQLKLAHSQLEQKVEERTAQLNETICELEALFNNSQVGILVLDGGRFFHKGNQRLADILGYTNPSEMQDFSMLEFHLTEEQFHEFGEKYFYTLKNKELIQVEYQLKRKDGKPVWCTLSGKALDSNVPVNLDEGVVWIVDDISEKKQSEIDRERLLLELQRAMREVNQLSGLLPICSHCKKIRDDQGYWRQIESYIQNHSEIEFSHSICKECAKKHYPDYEIYKEK